MVCSVVVVVGASIAWVYGSGKIWSLPRGLWEAWLVIYTSQI